MDLSKTQLIESVFAGNGEVATRLRELDWSATPLGPVEQWPQALRTIVRAVLGSGYPMAICWSRDYVLLYNEAYRPIAGTRHPWALGRGAREVYPEAWDMIGPMYESVMARGQATNFLSDVLVPLTRNNYLEEVYIAFSASPIWDDNGRIGGVLNSALETTQRVLEGRRRQLLRDLASRAAGARTEDEVWRVSAETLGENLLSIPFAFLYECRPSEHQAYLAGSSVETDEALRPPVIDCHKVNLWRFDPALARDGVVVDLGNRASGVPVPNWPDHPREASVVPIRLGGYGEALGFLVAGIHPGRAFDDAYRQFVQRIAEQITIGLTSARAYGQERDKLRASEERLEETSRLYREQQRAATELQIQVDLLQQLPVSAWTLKPDGTPDFVNRVWLEFAGQTLDFVRSRPEAWMTVVHPEDREKVTGSFWEGVSTGRGFVFENRSLRAHDGIYRWHLQQAVPLRDAEGNILKFVGTTTDIDDQKRAQEALADLDRAKTTFFSNVSHEFRTPLTLMLGPLEELQQEAREQLSPQQYGQLAAAHRNALRLLKLVNTLLDFSRLEAGRLQAVYQPTDLASFTAQIASMFRSAMDNAGLQFTVECPPMAEPVYVDRDMWEKIVLNLLSNAFKFTFQGEVAVTLKPVDGAAELQVRDTGVGIAEEHRERLFQRFHRIETTQARTYEGTGIGLALVEELVKLHGGSVRVESAVNVGSTFTVTIPGGKEHLPAERVQAAELPASSTVRAQAYVEEANQWLADESSAADEMALPPQPASPASLPESQPAEKRELILLADDNADMRRHLANMLGDRYEVRAVANGRQALEAARELHPALVLTDVMMPRLDGFGLLRAIRDDASLAGTPVILLSARAGEDWRVQGLQADADDYLVKPFTARELLARVAMQVRMAKLRRETVEREERLRSEANLEREKLRASEERLAETSRLYGELQRADAELQLQVELLQLLPVSAWTLKPDGTPDFVNQVWLEFAGQTLDFVRSHPEAWMTAVHPEDREMAARSFWEGVRRGEGFAFETRSLRAKDGTYRWHLNQAVVLRDAEGKVLKFVGTTTDIDDQKRAEEKIRQSEKEARQLLDLSPMHIGELGPEGARRYTNRASLDYYGISLEEWQGADLRQMLHPQDAETVGKDLPEKLQGGSPFEYEVRLRRKDGQYRWFHYRLSPVWDEQGRITRWYAAGTDIEDRKAAEQRLQDENVLLREEIDKTSMFEEIVGNSAPLKKVVSLISKVAPTDSSVLITGETGTGKELVARAIHRRSERAAHPFVSVNCAVIPRDLIASELFGHEKGSFTGATQRRLGRFELAEKGTIFLDEVGELPAETQVALLRVLQEHEFERIGGTGTLKADVRVIAATNRDLEAAIAAGTFRSDLFYRLNVFPVEVPPLRERSEDIPLLVGYFLERYGRKAGKSFEAVNKQSLDVLRSYSWPGNIRELQNVIERSVIVSDGEIFSVDENWLSRQPRTHESKNPLRLPQELAAQEKEMIEAALRECLGRVSGPTGAAARLGMPGSTLESKIKSLKIDKNRFKTPTRT